MFQFWNLTLFCGTTCCKHCWLEGDRRGVCLGVLSWITCFVRTCMIRNKCQNIFSTSNQLAQKCANASPLLSAVKNRWTLFLGECQRQIAAAPMCHCRDNNSDWHFWGGNAQRVQEKVMWKQRAWTAGMLRGSTKRQRLYSFFFRTKLVGIQVQLTSL